MSPPPFSKFQLWLSICFLSSFEEYSKEKLVLGDRTYDPFDPEEFLKLLDEDSKRILKEMTQLMDSYHFLLKADERKTKISLGKTMVQLAAFGLFTYTDWSWKKRRKKGGSNEATGI